MEQGRCRQPVAGVRPDGHRRTAGVGRAVAGRSVTRRAPRAVLPHLSQRSPGRPGYRPGRHRPVGAGRRAGGRRAVGAGHPQAPYRVDAAHGSAAPGRGGDRQVRRLARGRDRPRGGGPTESRADGDAPSAEPHRISERNPRSAGARHRRREVGAGRRPELRIRQHRRRAEGVADPARTVHERGARDQPSGGRRVTAGAGRRDVPHRLRPLAVPAP